jgi:hypothetical protein
MHGVKDVQIKATFIVRLIWGFSSFPNPSLPSHLFDSRRVLALYVMEFGVR